MDSDNIQDRSSSVENASSGEVEAESNNNDSLEVVSSGGATIRELDSIAEMLTRVELDLACSSEKLVNLDILVMHVASRENDFEAFALEDEHTSDGRAEKALEFDLLYGFLDSEVTELESLLSALQAEIVRSKGSISSFKQLGDGLKEIEEKLQDCEDTLKISFEQVSGIKMQSANFRKILLASSGDGKWNDENEFAGSENGGDSDINAKIKMQTSEQQRNILRMLEKSLAREMDTEKKLTESRQTEEDLKFRLQHEVYCLEVEGEDMLEKLLEAENSAEILLGISKELFGRIQVAQFSISESIQREQELRSKLQDSTEHLKEKDCALQVSENSRAELVEKVNSLEEKLSEFESKLHNVKESSEQNKELNGKVTEAEMRAEIAEAECEILRESNMKLNMEVSRLKSSNDDATGRLEQLEKRLKDSEMKQVHANASAEASQEKQSMLEQTTKDMDNLIKDLKSKVLKAENQTESAEEKCIILSESNAEFIEEINFLRHRMEELETSLLQADEAKKDTAKTIKSRSKVITDLVMQLSVERERLHKQISSLTKEKKLAAKYLQQIKMDSKFSVNRSHESEVKEQTLSESVGKSGTSTKGSNDELMESSATSNEIGNADREVLKPEIRTDLTDSTSELNNTVRNIDTRQLKFKYVFIAVLVLAIPAFAAFLFQH
ncbi:hypothetical protein ABFX02_08G035600 [Erythranthe guttata]